MCFSILLLIYRIIRVHAFAALDMLLYYIYSTFFSFALWWNVQFNDSLFLLFLFAVYFFSASYASNEKIEKCCRCVYCWRIYNSIRSQFIRYIAWISFSVRFETEKARAKIKSNITENNTTLILRATIDSI